LAHVEEKRGETKKEKLYIPRVMAETMLAATANSTSTHYGFGHMCMKHNKLFTLEHIETCDEMSGCTNIRRYANRLRSQHILDWEPEERHAAILEFALLTV